MLTFAKGVGNGITLAGIVARAELFDAINVTHFSTFGGNPLSAAGGLATINEVVENDLQGNALRMGSRLRAALDDLVEETPWLIEARGKGLMQALETVQPDTLEPSPERAVEMMERCKDHGLLVGKGGLYGNVLRISPMLNVSVEDMDTGIASIRAAAGTIS